MGSHVIEYSLPSGNREEKRRALIMSFLNEEAGTGHKAEASRYRYNVDSYQQYQIFLKRPTQLNKGFDFTVNVEGMYFKKNRRYSNPSHQDIFDALSDCKDNYSQEYSFVRDAIRRIYDGEDVNMTHINASFLDYEGKKRPIQVILLAIKWLFMEQDCAYWNYSGRKMLFFELQRRELV